MGDIRKLFLFFGCEAQYCCGAHLGHGLIRNSSASPAITNVSATASGGTNNYGLYVNGYYTVFADRSTFDGGTNSIYIEIYNEFGGTLYMGASELMSAGVLYGTGYHCVGVYKYIGETLSEADGTCN